MQVLAKKFGCRSDFLVEGLVFSIFKVFLFYSSDSLKHTVKRAQFSPVLLCLHFSLSYESVINPSLFFVSLGSLESRSSNVQVIAKTAS